MRSRKWVGIPNHFFGVDKSFWNLKSGTFLPRYWAKVPFQKRVVSIPPISVLSNFFERSLHGKIKVEFWLCLPTECGTDTTSSKQLWSQFTRKEFDDTPIIEVLDVGRSRGVIIPSALSIALTKRLLGTGTKRLILNSKTLARIEMPENSFPKGRN